MAQCIQSGDGIMGSLHASLYSNYKMNCNFRGFQMGGAEYRELQEELEELGMGEYDQRKGPTYFHLQE